MSLAGVVQRLRPERQELVDATLAVVLSALGVIGFRTIFSGNEELIVGVPAVIAGGLAGYVVAKLRATLLVAVVSCAGVALILAGPLALRHRTIAGVIPTPSTLSGFVDGAINGWIRLLTTLPPAGRAGDLLAVPYVTGFAGAALAVTLALRFPKLPLCLAPPTIVMSVTVLMGTRRPASLVLQGVVFGAVLVVWASLRAARARTLGRARLSRQRLVMAGGLLVLAGLSGLWLGPRLPGASAHERYVLREEVEPPFDPLTEPSALAGFRRYTDQEFREDEVLTVRGLPEGERLRIASMDDYDGMVWRSTGSGSVVAGQYLRVGATMPTDGYGEKHEVEVELHRPHGVWVPLGGDVASLSFAGADAQRLDDEVRVSIGSDTAAVPSKVPAGTRYRFVAEFVDLPEETELRTRDLEGRFRRAEVDAVPDEFIRLAGEWAGQAGTAYAEMANIGEQLRTEGRYTDGGPEATPISPPGHSLFRLGSFIAHEHPFGNGEQFGATLGLMAQARGLPVRVVMGFVNEDGDDEVTFVGEDIRSWIEIPIDGVGWVAIDGTPPTDQVPEPVVEPRTMRPNPEPQPPPPTTIPPPTSIPAEIEGDEEEAETEEAGGNRVVAVLGTLIRFVGIPGSVVGVPILLILGLKKRRRTRRRTTGTPSQRLTGSFAELVDYARDTGIDVPARATRLELSAAVGPVAVGLATRSNAAVFQPGEPPDVEVDAAWQEFVATRSELVAEMKRIERVRAALSLRSLRRRK